MSHTNINLARKMDTFPFDFFSISPLSQPRFVYISIAFHTLGRFFVVCVCVCVSFNIFT